MINESLRKTILMPEIDMTKIGIILLSLTVFLEFNCKKKTDGTLPPSTANSIKVVTPSEACKMVIGYSNYDNPGIPIKARIDPADSNVFINWSSADVGNPNQGSPVVGTCNPGVSLTNPDGNAVTKLYPGVYNSTFYGGDDYLITASSAGYGLDISPTITLYKKMHIEVDWQSGLEPDLSWVNTKFGYTAPGLSASTYILVETHIDDTDLTSEALYSYKLGEYVRDHHQHRDSFTVYLCGIKEFTDAPTTAGFSRSARGDTGWSFIAVGFCNSAWPDSPAWMDTAHKATVVHELGHQTFLAGHCATSGCIMDYPISGGERDTVFCSFHLNDLKGIPRFWREP